MKKSLFLISLLWFCQLFSIDRFFDLSINTDFSNLKERSHIDLNTQAIVPFQQRSMIINPRLSVFFDGTMDASVAMGMRHDISYGILGHHVFWDSSWVKGARFHQIGHSLDFLTESLDFRINYYHPITTEQESNIFLFSSHRWIEAETVLKTNLLHIGIGPKYDLFQKTWGAQARFIVPLKFFSIGTLVSHENATGWSGCFSLSFRLYSSARDSLLSHPVCHRSRVQYSKEIIYVAPPVIQKPSEQKTEIKIEIEEPKQEITIIVQEPEVDIAPPVAITPPTVLPPVPPPAKPSWWSFFFRTHQQ
jgi:hypothetical protein